MNKDDTFPPGGLLSKVVSFVRNPAVSWAEADPRDSERESRYSKQMLKEMIERKRRNDSVRRREFDQLRRLHRREPLQDLPLEDASARTSFFQNSMASPDDRAVTLKKIDEIEAQMSQQWWRGKAAGAAPAERADAPPTTRHVRLRTAAAPLSQEAQGPEDAFAATEPVALAGAPGPLAPQTLPPLFDADEWSAPAAAAAAVVAPPPFAHDPELEEAAILFANGDLAGALQSLRELLAQRRAEDPQQQHEVWMALFDLQRAAGLQEGFESLSIDYASQFGRSAPLWFSLPEQLGLPSLVAASDRAPAAQHELHWSAPALLTVQSVAALQASLAQAASPWTLNWVRLTGMEPPAVAALAQLVERWAQQPGQWRFFGAPALRTVLQRHTESGDRESDPQWWRLRMALLRLMGQEDVFELVALDYCITYEVSPPAWERARCGYSGDEEMPLDEGAAAGAPASAPALEFDAPALAPVLAPVSALSGQIVGDASQELDAMAALIRPGQPFEVSCERLIRIDFAAAGSVLNWAAEQQAQGHRLRFTRLHRLAAVFFNVVGVNEHAAVELRTD